MNIRLLVICFLLCCGSPLYAQSLRAYERAGDQAFSVKDYGTAFQHYHSVLSRDADNDNVLWKYAEAARYYFACQEADRAYRKLAASKKASRRFPLLYYHVGKLKQMQGEYDAAIVAFEKFLSDAPKVEKNLFEEAKEAVEMCKTAQKLSLQPSKAEVTRLSKSINSPYSDFAPIVVGDTLFYSSYRFEDKRSTTLPKKRLTKVMISSNGGRGREPGRGFPTTDTAHVAHTAFSPDGHYIFFTVCDTKSPTDIRCEIWLTVLDRRNRWMTPIRLPEPVNLPGYTSTQPAVGYDAYFQGPVLWFSSDRPGGSGKMDLWYMPLDTNFFCECNLPFAGKKLGPLPLFPDPVNAAAVNTAGNDITPFFHTSSHTLYFSSDERPGLGGYDIYSVQKALDCDTLYGQVENLGPGLNSSGNDIYFYLKKEGTNGYLSSNRAGSQYLDEGSKALCNDLYAFKWKMPEPPKPINPPLLVNEKKLTDSTERSLVFKSVPPEKEPLTQRKSPGPEPAPDLHPVPPEIKEFIGLPLYFDNDEPDRRTQRTTTRKSYEETAHEYLTRQNVYREQMTNGLSGKEETRLANLTDDFFENEVRKGFDRLNQLCEVLLLQLQEGKRFEIVIKGFTSPRANTEYNMNLGKRRISSVRNHLLSFSEGALAPYLESGALLFTEASFGETVAPANVSDNLTDERNSIYHPDAARERRVEIVGILRH